MFAIISDNTQVFPVSVLIEISDFQTKPDEYEKNIYTIMENIRDCNFAKPLTEFGNSHSKSCLLAGI